MNTTLISIRIAAAASLLAAMCWSCSGDNQAIQQRYELEKTYFDAEKLAGKADIKPELVDKEQIAQIQEAFSKVAKQGFEALAAVDSTTHAKEYHQIADLVFRGTSRYAQYLFANTKFDSVAYWLGRLVRETPLTRDQAMISYYNLGQAYQYAGRADSALAKYAYTVETFFPPVDSNKQLNYDILNLPMQVHGLLVRVQDSSRARDWRQRAENYYRKMISEYPNTEPALASQANLAALYEGSGEYTKAVEALNKVTDSTGQVAIQARIKIGDLYATALEDPTRALREYEATERQMAGRDTAYRPIVMLKRSIILLMQRKYLEGRELMVAIKAKYPRYFASNPAAQLNMARSFDLAGNWDRAETEYKFLIDNYSGSNEAFGAYLYLIETYNRLGRTAESNQWSERAERDFAQIAASKAGEPEEGLALVYTAELYRQKEDWPRAAAILSQVYEKFPSTDPGRRALATAATIYRDKLNNAAKADSLIQVLKDAMLQSAS